MPIINHARDVQQYTHVENVCKQHCQYRVGLSTVPVFLEILYNHNYYKSVKLSILKISVLENTPILCNKFSFWPKIPTVQYRHCKAPLNMYA